jgi:regulatory protein
MPVITGIKAQKSKKRVNIYVDGNFSFGLDLENLLRYGLREGKVITEEQIKEIVKKAEFSKVSDKIIQYGLVRPRSEKEFRDWLKKYKVHTSIHKELFKKLKRLELLGDKSFALWWISQRVQFRPKSKIVLSLELRQKGVSKEIIDEALSEIVIDEKSVAKEILLKKKRVWENLSPDQIKKRMYAILLSKGFSMTIIKKAVESLLTKEE